LNQLIVRQVRPYELKNFGGVRGFGNTAELPRHKTLAVRADQQEYITIVSIE